jgi:hypothetical protein
MLVSAPSGPTLLDPDSIKVPRRAWWCRASILTAVIFAAVLLNNSELVFQSRQYEADDLAANSLQILKARQFRETLGHYCRFGFHHSGPAFFYVFAWGEILFFDATHAVPTPFNGQLIAWYGLSAILFSAALMIVARRLGKGRLWFMGFALLLAAWHFGAVGKFYNLSPDRPGLFCLWPPCLLVFPFLCFLVAAASVAAGEVKDLAVMTVAACFLVHGHVAMPLFVVPLTILAYIALLWQLRQSQGEEGKWPWQTAPRQHWLAAGTIGLFLVPIVIDLVTAHPNNLQRIVEHLDESYGERKSLLQSALYFLHFGAYSTYPSTNSIPAFETFDWPGTLLFFKTHWKAYGLWLVVVVLCVVLPRSRLRQKQTGDPAEIEAWRFRQRLCLVLFAGIALSIVWGCIQEGPMFYYNSFFNFAIYYAALLIFALTCALWIQERVPRWPARLAFAARVALFIAVAAAFGQEARRFRGVRPDQAEQARFAASIEEALALDPVQPKFFNFDWQAGGQTTRVALYLERHGIRWWVREDWPLYFGAEHIVKPGQPDHPVLTLSSSFWRVALHSSPNSTEGDTRAIVLPLNTKFDLVIHPAK